MKKTIIFSLILFLLGATIPIYAAQDPLKGDDNRMNIYINNSCLNKDLPIKIVNSKGSVVKDAKVTVTCRSKKTDYGMTDDNGLFVYKAVNTKAGANEILVRKDGYNDETIIINISNQCAAEATTTTVIVTTSSSIASTTTSSTTTTILNETKCDEDGLCAPEKGENFLSCPLDCASGKKDDYCDRQQEGVCDPDCERGSDIDCFCNNNGVCEPPFDTYQNCPSDCRLGEMDGFCDTAPNNGICDPDCAEGIDGDCKKFDYGALIVPLIIILIVFGVIVALNLKRQSKVTGDEKSRDDLVDNLKNRLKDGEDPKVLKEELIGSGQDVKLLEIAEKKIWE